MSDSAYKNVMPGGRRGEAERHEEDEASTEREAVEMEGKDRRIDRKHRKSQQDVLATSSFRSSSSS